MYVNFTFGVYHRQNYFKRTLFNSKKQAYNHLFLRADKMDGDLQKIKRCFYVLSSISVQAPPLRPAGIDVSFPSHPVSLTKATGE